MSYFLFSMTCAWRPRETVQDSGGNRQEAFLAEMTLNGTFKEQLKSAGIMGCVVGILTPECG